LFFIAYIVEAYRLSGYPSKLFMTFYLNKFAPPTKVFAGRPCTLANNDVKHFSKIFECKQIPQYKLTSPASFFFSQIQHNNQVCVYCRVRYGATVS